jgi:hypothetical protein
MKTKSYHSFIVLALLALLTLDSQVLTVFAQGALTPSGSPAPTMKSLDQIEARTPIYSLPYLITNPGSYYLVSNLNLTINTNAITITTNEVTLDLNGFTITTSVFRGIGAGILLDGGNSDITIANGHISGGNYQYLGNGITYSGTMPLNVHVSNVSVSECIANGIYLGTNSSTLVESCRLQGINDYGVEAGIILHSQAQSGDTAIAANFTASDCVGTSVGGVGVLVNGTANNCYGTSYSGIGLSANNANNCYGSSTTEDGLNVAVALNCYGYSNGGIAGLYAVAANNSYGFNSSSSGYGLYAANVAIGCFGSDTAGGGIGLFANIANSCSSSGLLTYNYHYNMPP